MAKTLPFTLITAFTNDPFAGNPAAVVFLDNDLPEDILRKIARNINQPITSFVSTPLPSGDEKTAGFRIQWFTTEMEVLMCGHGTLAAAKAIFTRPGMVSEKVEVIELHTSSGKVVAARKLDDEWLEIQLPSTIVEEVSPSEKQRLQALVAKALKKENVTANFIGKGGKGFEYYLLVELDEKVNLAECKVVADELINTGYEIHTITTASSSGDALFVSRMFAPVALLGGEDAVCGSAHCLLGPYWARKRGLDGSAEIKAKQVSARGGDLRLIWEEEKGIIRLRGQSAVIAKGEFVL